MTLYISIGMIAVILAILEVLLPGGILGILSALALITSTVIVYNTEGMLPAIFTAGIELTLIIICALISLKVLEKTSLGKNYFLKEKDEHQLNTTNDKQEFIGLVTTAYTPFAPEGLVKIKNKSYEAHSIDGFIEKGHAIEIINVTNFYLTVKKIKKSK